MPNSAEQTDHTAACTCKQTRTLRQPCTSFGLSRSSGTECGTRCAFLRRNKFHMNCSLRRKPRSGTLGSFTPHWTESAGTRLSFSSRIRFSNSLSNSTQKSKTTFLFSLTWPCSPYLYLFQYSVSNNNAGKIYCWHNKTI